MHLGHLALVAAARAAVGHAGTVKVLVLDPHPSELLGRVVHPRLSGTPERLERLLAGGVDEVAVLPVTTDLLSTPAVPFLRGLHQQERFCTLVEGSDFRFGEGRVGDLHLARSLGGELGFSVVEVPEKQVEIRANVVMSPRSSLIRRELEEGNLLSASKLLGRPFSVRGVVQPGAGQARMLGWPTANIDPRTCCVPPAGVYAGAAQVRGFSQWHPAAIHLGPRPSQAGLDDSLEAVLLGGDANPLDPVAGSVPPVGDYGWSLELQFFRRLRDIRRFSDLSALRSQIREDAVLAVAQFGAGCSIAP